MDRIINRCGVFVRDSASMRDSKPHKREGANEKPPDRDGFLNVVEEVRRM